MGEDGAKESRENAAKLAKAVIEDLSDLTCPITLVANDAKGADLRIANGWFGVKRDQDLIYF